MKRVACYVRVSTEEQRDHGISVDNQINELTKYCEENKYKIVGLYNDAGISARKSYKKRPALLQLLEDVRLNKIDLIIFTKLDRWFRSVADYYDVQRILDEYGVKWRCIWEDYETETSSGVFKVNIMLSVAQSEADRTSERIQKVFEYKKAKGEVCSGKVGLGYKIENKRWVKDEATSYLVEELFNTYFATFSIRKCQERMLELGHSMALITVQHILKSPAYYGGISYVSEPYITLVQHETIMKAHKKYVKQRKNEYIFKGLCTCSECGSKLYGKAYPRKYKDGKDYVYLRYVCMNHVSYPDRCSGTAIGENKLEELLINKVNEALISHNMEAKIENHSDVDNKIEKIKGKLKRIKDIYELGDMDFSEYKEKRRLYLDEIKQLEDIPEKKVKELPKNWYDTYLTLDSTHKNAFWLSIIDNIEIDNADKNNIKIFF